jgi:bifunctional DNA-binding transcriptional regulator/antitoxin component of YhaV-PrlF toxin-antitoxin module
MLTAETGLIFCPMTFTVKTESDTLPAAVRQQAGIKLGDMLEFKVSGGVVTIIPKLPTADDEYTPGQRAIVDAQLAEGLEDIRKGRVSPKFDTVDEMLASLKAGHKSKPRQKKPHSR